MLQIVDENETKIVSKRSKENQQKMNYVSCILNCVHIENLDLKLKLKEVEPEDSDSSLNYAV